MSVKNIAGGKEVCLAPTPSSLEDNPVDCYWSPDSKLLAYIILFDRVGIVSADGGQPKIIIEVTPEMKKAGQYPWPRGWTSDSKKLIFQVNARQSREGLYAIPIAGGKWQEIYKF